jgi:hypothetical protein
MTWQSIETAPTDGTDILIYDGDTISIVFFDEENDVWMGQYNEIMNGPWWPDFKCWMPLPEPPK